MTIDSLAGLHPVLSWMPMDGFSIRTPIKKPAYPGDVGYDLAANLPTTPEGAATLLAEQKTDPAHPGTENFIYNPQTGIYSIMPFCFMDVPVGIRAEVVLAKPLPNGVNLSIEVRPRSSTWRKRRLNVALGTIDVGYRGPWFFTLQNPNPYPVKIINGDWLAQAVFQLNVIPDLQEATGLSESARGTNGFGSSDKTKLNSGSGQAA